AGAARAADLRACALDVAVTNGRAQALYERLGYRVVAERTWRPDRSGVLVPSQRRMELPLR
ncbi:hypothetical protein, partial [Deinococcus pimensis]|uniref:hypothetical protein n=1 Tax=Deinococcus pimensis TaxID=309888 RepID=UPI001B7FDBD4